MQIDPSLPATVPADQLQDFKPFLDQVLADITRNVAPQVHQAGASLWRGMGAVMVVWSGLKMAFSGTIQSWEWVRLVMGLAIPWTLLTFYYQNIPGTSWTFPQAVVAQGNWMMGLMMTDMVRATQEALSRMIEQIHSTFTDQVRNLNVAGLLWSGSGYYLKFVVGVFLTWSLLLLLLALFAITYAQVIWAHVAVAIVILVGPLMIPWLLFEPMAFLFWGWFRALVVYSLYGVVAAVILRVFVSVSLTFLSTLMSAGFNISDLQQLGLWVLFAHAASGGRNPGRVQGRGDRLVAGFRSGKRRSEPDGHGRIGGGSRPSRRFSKARKVMRSKDAGREYAEIWGETVQSNRHLRLMTGVLGVIGLVLAILVLRLASIDPPKPIVIRVDEVGRAEALAYEAVQAHADPLDPTTKYFLNRFIHDFYSRQRATVEQHWTRSLRFLTTDLANAAFEAESQNIARVAARIVDRDVRVENVVLRLACPSGRAAQRHGRFRTGAHGPRAGSRAAALVAVAEVRVSPRDPARPGGDQPHGHRHHLSESRPGLGDGGEIVIEHLHGREKALARFGWKGRKASGSPWCVCTAACSRGRNSVSIYRSIAGGPCDLSGP